MLTGLLSVIYEVTNLEQVTDSKTRCLVISIVVVVVVVVVRNNKMMSTKYIKPSERNWYWESSFAPASCCPEGILNLCPITSLAGPSLLCAPTGEPLGGYLVTALFASVFPASEARPTSKHWALGPEVHTTTRKNSRESPIMTLVLQFSWACILISAI